MGNPIDYWYQKYIALKAKMDEMMAGELVAVSEDLKREIETQLAIFPYTKVSPELPESRFLVIQKELFLFAQHFAKWGADHTPLPEDTVLFNKGVAEGKRLMMEEALEGEITTDNRGNNVLRAGVLNNGFEIGDKVKIIVINE